MFCNVCGHNVRDGAAFCDVCGAPIAQPKKMNPDTSDTSRQDPSGYSGIQYQMYQQPGTPNQSGIQQPGSRLALIMAIVAGVVVLGTLCILLFVTPGFLRRTKDADKTSYQSATESKTEGLTEKSSVEVTIDTEAVTESTTEKTETEVTTEAVTEMSAEDQKNALLAEAANLSTAERPNIAQFFWYTEGVRWDGIPAGIENISQRELLEGDWMMYMVTDPYYKANSYSERYLNANIHLEDDGSSVVIVLDWWTMTYEGGTVDEAQYGDEKFTGSYDVSNRMVTQSSSYNSLILTDYWKRGRNQFITGTFAWNDGVEGLVALVRPGENIEYEQSDNIYDYSKNAPDYSTFEPETEATTEAKTEAPKQTNKITDEELLRRACRFTGAPFAEIESIDPGTGYYNIHCYDIIDDGGGYSHVNTYNWLTIDPVTLTGHDISGDPVNLN